MAHVVPPILDYESSAVDDCVKVVEESDRVVYMLRPVSVIPSLVMRAIGFGLSAMITVVLAAAVVLAILEGGGSTICAGVPAIAFGLMAVTIGRDLIRLWGLRHRGITVIAETNGLYVEMPRGTDYCRYHYPPRALGQIWIRSAGRAREGLRLWQIILLVTEYPCGPVEFVAWWTPELEGMQRRLRTVLNLPDEVVEGTEGRTG